MAKLTSSEKSFLKKIVPLTAFIGGLCCFTPLVLVLLGLSSVSFAASLSNTLYGQYRWAFRGVALLFLLGALAWYFYKKEDICTLDKLKRKKRKIINVVLLSLVLGVFAYVVWLYVIVEIYTATNLDTGEEIVKERDFWFAWYAFHPETQLYEAKRT